jgi:spermidine synthase
VTSGIGRGADRALCALFAVSGASGLTFQVLWARQLGTVVGATTQAITTVVAVFMGGLALGGLLGARLAPRLRRPLAWYGLTELAIGATALVVSLVMPALEGLASLGGRYVAATICLLGASGLMGMTYPLVVASSGRAGRAGGVLYALNTAGAAVGCLLAGFLGVGLIGVRATALVAAALNVLCGAGALALARRADPVAEAPEREPPMGAHPSLVLVIAFGCGAAGLATEILWTRALIPYLNSSTYAFTAILTVFLLALAAGSGAAARGLDRLTPAGAAGRLLVIQIALAVAVAATPRLMGLIEQVFTGYVGVRRVMTLADWLATVSGVFLRTSAVIALPALLMGASFPLTLRLLPDGGARGGRNAGLVSAANTLGGIVGSLAAGFALLPAIGVIVGLTVAAAVALAIAGLLLARFVVSPAARQLATALLASAAVALLLLLPARRVPFVGRLADNHQLVLLDEGPQDTTAVVDVGAGDERQRLIFSNGISYTGDNAPSRRYMRLLGHLPALLADDPADSLVICVGTGMTAAAVARHPEVKALALVDISPVVRRTLPLFAPVNDRIWTDPRVNIVRADGRQFMGASRRPWGVITLEPPPPRAAGAASLYTAEIYQRARRSLRPGGVIAQWLPLHGLTEAELLLLSRTFLQVFPDAALFMLNPHEAALLGSPGPLVLDAARLRGRLAVPAVAAGLGDIGFPAGKADALLAEIAALSPLQGADLARFVGPGPVVTDDRPLAESFAAVLGEDAGAPAGEEPGRAAFVRHLLARTWQAPPLSGPVSPRLTAAVAAAQARLRQELNQSLPQAFVAR